MRADRKLAYRKDALLRRLWAAGWMRGRMAAGAAARGRPLPRAAAPARRRAGARGRPSCASTPRAVAPRPAQLLAAAGVRDPDAHRGRRPRRALAEQALAGGGVRRGRGRRCARGRALEPVIVGDAADREAAEAVRALIPGGAALAGGRHGSAALAALLKRARVVVANDSGPAHLAAAVGTPVVALFGPTHEAFGFAPRGGRVRVISRDLPCRPCTVHGGVRCPRGRRAASTRSRRRRSLAAALALVQARQGPPRVDRADRHCGVLLVRLILGCAPGSATLLGQAGRWSWSPAARSGAFAYGR